MLATPHLAHQGRYRCTTHFWSLRLEGRDQLIAERKLQILMLLTRSFLSRLGEAADCLRSSLAPEVQGRDGQGHGVKLAHPPPSAALYARDLTWTRTKVAFFKPQVRPKASLIRRHCRAVKWAQRTTPGLRWLWVAPPHPGRSKVPRRGTSEAHAELTSSGAHEHHIATDLAGRANHPRLSITSPSNIGFSSPRSGPERSEGPSGSAAIRCWRARRER